MVSKKVSKISSKKRTYANKDSPTSNVDKILIENFISLQKVMTKLSERFEYLSEKIEDLLKLFEDSAKTVIEKEFHPIDEKSKKEIERKIDKIIDQNKIIAKGLTLMHDNVKEPENDYNLEVKPYVPKNEVEPKKREEIKPQKPTFSEKQEDPFSEEFEKRFRDLSQRR